LFNKVTWLNAHGYIRPSIVKDPFLQEKQIKSGLESGIFSLIKVTNDSVACSGIIENEFLFPLRFAIIVTAKNKFGLRKFVGLDNSGYKNWTISIPLSRLEKGNILLEAWLMRGDDGLFYSLAEKHVIKN